jgi:cytochrome b561
MKDAETYRPAARHMHWLIAGILVIMIPVAFFMGDAPPSIKGTLYSTHKLVGVIVLLLVIFRLIYRFKNPPPAPDASLKPWEIFVSSSVHWLLYVLLLAVPLLGWLGVSAFGALNIYGSFNLPALIGTDKELAKTLLFFHGWIAIGMAILIGLHIAAALQHHFIRKDTVLRRMWPKKAQQG